MIINKEAKKEKRIEIDLSGPQGNAFYLLGLAYKLEKQLGFGKQVTTEMKSGDYENLLAVFEKYFGDYVILYR